MKTLPGITKLLTAKFLIEGFWKDQNGCPVSYILGATDSEKQVRSIVKTGRETNLYDKVLVNVYGIGLFNPK